MTHTYEVSGMTCDGCEAKVKYLLMNVEHVTSVEVSREQHSATISMDSHIPLSTLQKALGDGKYRIRATNHNELAEHAKSSWQTYRPVILIFAYITGVTLLVQSANESFSYMQWMRHFMAGFFLIFSFFKLLDLKGFAETYAMYDVVARKFPAWGFLYAFLELGIGIAYLVNFNPAATSAATLVVMSVSIIGVLKSVLDKRKIQCACLGAVFNLPMSTVTIIEDGLMIAMSAVMLLLTFSNY